MNINEIIEREQGNYYDVEVYQPIFSNDDYHARGLHGDFVDYVEDYTGTEEVIKWAIMGEDDYNNSILANCCVQFDEIYEKNDKILVILISKKEML